MNLCLCPNCGGGTQRAGCWYNKSAWHRVARAVVTRDMRRCYVVNCHRDGNCADHRNPVHSSMSWAEFISMAGLRAACRYHNTTRGKAAKLEREEAEGMAPAAVVHPLVSRRPFLGGGTARHRPLFASTHTRDSLRQVKVAGTGRRKPE